MSLGSNERRRRPGPRRPAVVLAMLLLALAALVAQDASLPHTHSAVGVGIYNLDHDLSLLAAAGAVGPLPITPVVFVIVVIASLFQSAPPAPAGFVCRDAESRAPPAS